MIALTYAIVSSTFSLFDFAKQMTDVSQARKGVAYSTSSGARRAGESAFLLLAFRTGVPRNEQSEFLGVLVALISSKKSG